MMTTSSPCLSDALIGGKIALGTVQGYLSLKMKLILLPDGGVSAAKDQLDRYPIGIHNTTWQSQNGGAQEKPINETLEKSAK